MKYLRSGAQHRFFLIFFCTFLLYSLLNGDKLLRWAPGLRESRVYL
ncbi:hypothetical protein QWZ13_17860 [Reinekea marina]|nr:hypothetical protein [Reinekea marina]MDN3650776.1 hypothetical protein [Reinekea marina]